MEPQTPKQSILTLPAAIIVAGAMIAIAIIWINKPATKTDSTNSQSDTVKVNMRDVTASDHILGNPNAPIKIVEYSDTECPYCKVYNATLTKITDEYGPSGKVAWVYRHWPLDKPDANGYILHKNSGTEAQALECAAALGGNDKFWAFEKRLYEVTPSVTSQSPEGLDLKELPEIAKFVGLNVVSFNECLSSNRFKEKVETDYQDGIKAGARGTPYSVIITPNGSKVPTSGALSYSTLKSAIDALLLEAGK